ncbi:hypothetical protein PSTG_10305 [Puccinia striiformis f. sp. tritici PST-78]|uniref:tRNA-splicing endonuclease subunit Sen54 N-terminal domain-containing protein n=1 Tax=Puccinia striiformis f. sp. tritici PST-78 TaxID=1165861 RepID=A0A0L0VAM9_9BASI|nr:hypothetical protein PSTG_10305 [Puccinia striiformis f. sp. tritici PST-78]
MDRPIEEEDAVEEEAPDWRMLLKYTKSLGAQSTTASHQEPFIPRRGEKDFEPTEAQAPTQLKALQESRQALFTALSAGIRGHSSRDHVRCIFTGRPNHQGVVPPLSYVQGTAKGVLFSSIGRWSKEKKRLELNPEELLYLVERGTVECWSDPASAHNGSTPLSVQQAWTQIIGTHQLSLDRYQVYAYLKRLGYIVLRKEDVDSVWLSSSSSQIKAKPTTGSSFMINFLSLIHNPLFTFKNWFVKSISRLFIGNSDLGIGKRISTLALLNHSLIHDRSWTTYESVFNSLSLTPSGPKIDLPNSTHPPTRTSSSPCPSKKESDYKVFYYVYKPNHKFPKSNPPRPDFQVCVIDSEKMCIPDIGSMIDLLDTVKGPNAPLYPPPPPPPTLRTPATTTTPNMSNEKNKNSTSKNPITTRPVTTTSCIPLHQKIINLVSFGFFGRTHSPQSTPRKPRLNVFAKLKNGHRNVLLAVNDNGIISFLKFIESDFAGTPLVGSQSSI